MNTSTINQSIFREYDIRGLAGKDLSAEFARNLGLTYAEWAFKKTGKDRMVITVGRDCRLSSDEYGDALIAGLNEAGIDVIRIGIVPTPLTYFSIFHFKTDGAIMITGSHNPGEYNGFKVCIGTDTLHGEDIQELKHVMLAQKFTKRPPGKMTDAEIVKPYISYVADNIKPSRQLKVVLDAGNGMASVVAPLLFEAMGAKVIPLYCKLDGNFPNHHPDPTVPANLADLVKAVKEHGADFGVGYDGDADRIGAVDENGRILFGDELMIIYSREVLKTNPQATIISEVKSSNRLYQDIAKHGGKPLMWKTGHSLIKAKMKETKAALAGEMSGHIFFADRWFGFDDAIYASARLYEIVTKNGKFSQLTSDLAPVINTPELRIECDEDKKFKLISEAAKLLQDSSAKVTDIDGLRVDYDNRWGLIRASNTQPVIVMRFEAQTQALLNQIKKRFEDALTEAGKKLGHGPFHFDQAAH